MLKNEQGLPADLAAALAPHLRHALDSRPRRRILRALTATTDAQTLEELHEVVPASSTSTLSYHVLVLEREGCVTGVSQGSRGNGMVRTYSSNIADNRTVIDALRVTRREDDGLAD